MMVLVLTVRNDLSLILQLIKTALEHCLVVERIGAVLEVPLVELSDAATARLSEGHSALMCKQRVARSEVL